MKNVIKKVPREAEAVLELKRVYEKAEKDIIAEITRKRRLDFVDYADVAALERVQTILRNMTEEAEAEIRPAIEKYFYTEAEKVGASKGYANAMALTGTQTNIVETLINNYMGLVDEAAGVAYGSADSFLKIGRLEADRLRQLALTSVAEAEALGRSWRLAQEKMSVELINKGITAFTDVAGRNWDLTTYCNMATRTTARQAEVAAALSADDWDLWQISSIRSTCKICAAYEGRVYSKSGTNPDYPPLSAAFGLIDAAGPNSLENTYLNIHPNCLHSLTKYTTMGKTDAQIQRDKDYSSFEKRPANVDYRSKKQVEAYREKESARAKYRNDMKQFREYREALGNEMPKTFETFMKHKSKGDEIYKEWQDKFRTFNRISDDLLKEQRKGDIIDLSQIIVNRDPIISSYTSSEQIAQHFTSIKLDDSFSTLSLDTQKEIAQGWNYIKEAIGEEYLPKTVRVTRLEANTNAVVTPSKRSLLLSNALTEKEGLLSAVHESVHIADNKNGDIAEEVMKDAARLLKVRRGSRAEEKFLIQSMGASTYYKYRKDPSEQLAWCFEKSLRSDKTAYSEAVKEALLRRLGK